MHHGGGIVQSVLLDKRHFTKESAKHWITKHGYKLTSPDITNRFYRFRQQNPRNMEALHMRFRTIPLGKEGDLIIAYK
jgi:hypothetical protein